MSEIKVNKITPRAACGTTQLGDSGDTFTVPAGATISNLGTATGFGGTGVVSWDTASIKTTGFTAVTGTGYFCNTTGGAFTVTLPLSPSAGDVIGVADYAKTFDSDNVTLGRNSSKISGEDTDALLSTEGTAITLVYVDGVKGWLVTDSGNQSDAPLPLFVAGTGGCITTCGLYKMHTFLSPNTFTVTCAGNAEGSNSVDYLIVGGGGGGGGGYNSPANRAGGAGGAGGYRESNGTASGCYTVSPLATTPVTVPAVSVSATPYPIVIGGGGVGGHAPAVNPVVSVNGTLSSFATLESAGGGYGGSSYTPNPRSQGNSGGSGGGGSAGGAGCGCGGSGNTPPVSPPQGNDGGGNGTGPNYGGHGGGGATVAGTPQDNPGPSNNGGPGGAGGTSSINATPTGRAGGGGGGAGPGTGGTGGTGNPGGAGGNFPNTDGGAGTINSGGGGGGGAAGPGTVGGLGGSGIVIIRYRYQ